MKRIILQTELLLTIFIGTSLQAQIDTKVNLVFEDKVQSWLTENNVPAVGIGLVEDGKIKYVKVFGELKKGTPAPDNTVFNIASMTKPVVTMLTLKLVEAGQWDLNEHLCHYWVDPDIANDPRHKKLTTRHVLTHQTGFPNWRYMLHDNKLAFDFEPGTQYQYSGEGFEYLRKALEKKFNKPLDELLNSVIFAPLGMKNTGYWGKNVNKLNYAHFHDAQGNECKSPYPMGVSAAGLLFTTIEDYCKFEIDVINWAGLSPKIYNDMISPHVKMREHYYRGLGWEIIRDLPDGEYALEHGGGDPGVRTIAFILPRSKRGIVVLTNGDNGMFVYNNVVRESLDTGKILIDYLSNSFAHQAITLPDELLEKYAGTYYVNSGGWGLTIVKENGSLKASGIGFPTVVLFPETEKKFFSRDIDVQFESEGDSFNIIANGKLFFTVKKKK